MEKQPIFSIESFQMDMKVEVKEKQTSTTREGVVTKINLIKKSKMIDGRPVRSTRVAELIVTFTDGEKCVITPENFKNYKVQMLG